MTPTGNPDRYLEELGLSPGATPEQIQEAYRDLAKVWHPDRFGQDPRLRTKAEERLKRINEAREKLRDYRPRMATADRRRPDSGGPRIIYPRGSFIPKDRLWIVAVALAALVTFLLVLTAL